LVSFGSEKVAFVRVAKDNDDMESKFHGNRIPHVKLEQQLPSRAANFRYM
jgi:hypothetical protein